jgi:outer membrane biosynthesis protein TonB
VCFCCAGSRSIASKLVLILLVLLLYLLVYHLPLHNIRDGIGSCDGYSYEAGKETELSESVIKALGTSVQVTGEVQPGAPQEQQRQESNPAPQETQPEQKDVPTPPVDKMIGNEDAETKYSSSL